MSNFWWGMLTILIVLMSNVILILYMCFCRLPRIIDTNIPVVEDAITDNREISINEIQINPPNVVVIECPNNKIYVGVKLEPSLESP